MIILVIYVVQELALCKEYDCQMDKWENSVELIESNPKKR